MIYPLCTLYEDAVLLSRLIRVIEKLDVFGSSASQMFGSTGARPNDHMRAVKKTRAAPYLSS
jgi:hypothetical protein